MHKNLFYELYNQKSENGAFINPEIESIYKFKLKDESDGRFVGDPSLSRRYPQMQHQYRNRLCTFIEECKPYIQYDGGYGIHIRVLRKLKAETGFSGNELAQIISKSLGCTYRWKKNKLGKFLDIEQQIRT